MRFGDLKIKSEFIRYLTLQQQRTIHRNNQIQNAQQQMQAQVQMHAHALPQRGNNNSNQQLHSNHSHPIQPTQSQSTHHLSNQQQQVILEDLMTSLLYQRRNKLNGP